MERLLSNPPDSSKTTFGFFETEGFISDELEDDIDDDDDGYFLDIILFA